TCDPLLVRQMLSQLSYAPPLRPRPARHVRYINPISVVCQGVFFNFFVIFAFFAFPSAKQRFPSKQEKRVWGKNTGKE
ncbi:MAG: hypothetical protein Q4G00_14905, partial [Clostridia bacterium]|nr:hypothetical protein [Clostridia bacterium]